MNEDEILRSQSVIISSQLDFSHLLYNPLFSDFLIILSNPPENRPTSIPVHRFLLNAFSEYFREYFKYNPNEKSVQIYFPDWATPGIFDILQYIYSSQSILINVENISALVYVSCKWSVKSLITSLFEFLNTEIPSECSLSTLIKVSEFLPENSSTEKTLIKLVAQHFTLFKKEEFESIPFTLLMKIVQTIQLFPCDDIIYYALDDMLINYFLKNIVHLGSYEFKHIIQTFTMRVVHNGILTLYKIGLRYGWNVKLVETKILHSWQRFDKNELCTLPIESLTRLLHQNYINTESEDDLVDFILLVQNYYSSNPQEEQAMQLKKKNQYSVQLDDESDSSSDSCLLLSTNFSSTSFIESRPEIIETSGEDSQKIDLTPLWREIRLNALSPAYLAKLRESPFVPTDVKNMKCTSSYLGRRLPRNEIKCLILGSCDEPAMQDMKQMLLRTWLLESNVLCIDGSKPFDTNIFFNFHTIFIFSFYLFWNRKEISEKLYEFHQQGGGIIICYGAIRNDLFGLGEPFSSSLPFECLDPDLLDLAHLSHRNNCNCGCKTMRILCKPKEGAIVEKYWNDGIPLIIRQHSHHNGCGSIFVFNAIPVSNNIISDQWEADNKCMLHIFGNAIISVANTVSSRRKDIIKQEDH